MKHALPGSGRARTGWRWHHLLIVVVAVLGTVALVANLFGA